MSSDADSSGSPTFNEDQPEKISEDYKALFPPHKSETLDGLRTAGPDVVARFDEIVVAGMNAFFNNQFAHAEALFRGGYKEDPLVANAWGTLGSIKALLSFEAKDIDFASSQLVYSSAFGNGVQPKSEGVVKGLSNWWKGKTTILSPYQIRALLVVGESELLRANVLLIQDTMTGYIKAGLALRRGYNIYDRLQKYIVEFPDHGADANTIGGIHFGLGAIHVVTSVLPPKVYAVLKALGYMHDREVGMQHLQKCLRSRTLRSPIASLLLLAFYGILPSFAPLTMPRYVPLAESVIAETLAVYPKSMIHLWLSGRVARLKRETDKAIGIFRECVEHGASLREALPQLEHFALYDLAWAYMSKSDWVSAFHCFHRLEEESAWSKMFYTYAQAACLDMVAVDAGMESENARLALISGASSDTNAEYAQQAADVPSGCTEKDDQDRREYLAQLSPTARIAVCRILARRLYQRSIGAVQFKVGGKIISIEQFTKRRVKYKLLFDKTEQQREYLENPGAYSAEEAVEMCRGTDVENTAESTTEQDTVALRLVTGLELANHFNVFMQTEAGDLVRMAKYCDFFQQYKAMQAEAEDNAVVRILKANLQLAIGTDPECLDEFQSLIDAAPFENEKWIQPYAMYGRGVYEYQHGDAAAARETLTKTIHKKYGGKDYNFEMQMNFRLHLTADMFKQDDAAAKAAEKKREPTE